MFSLVSLVETDWSQFDVIIQSAAALTAMVIGAAYTITYFDSLKKTLDNKKLSFISFLPAFHGIAALAALFVWNYVNQMFQ